MSEAHAQAIRVREENTSAAKAATIAARDQLAAARAAAEPHIRAVQLAEQQLRAAEQREESAVSRGNRQVLDSLSEKERETLHNLHLDLQDEIERVRLLPPSSKTAARVEKLTTTVRGLHDVALRPDPMGAVQDAYKQFALKRKDRTPQPLDDERERRELAASVGVVPID